MPPNWSCLVSAIYEPISWLRGSLGNYSHTARANGGDLLALRNAGASGGFPLGNGLLAVAAVGRKVN
jgi:hypothetical protein